MELSGKTIFIVEDNRANMSIMLTTLQMAGAKTLVSRWGADAVKRMKKAEQIDLVLVDLMLPNGLTGYDVFDQIREVPEFADISLAVVSASDVNLEMRKAKEKGFTGFISKPISFTTFPKIALRLIEGHEYWADDSAVI